MSAYMPITLDRPMHHLLIECEGKPTALHCDVAMASIQESRGACNQEIFEAGWRLDGTRTLCPACLRRESERKTR